MPQVQRTPPQGNESLLNKAPECTPSHYASDSDLNMTSTGTVKEDNILFITKRAKHRLVESPGCSDALLGEFKRMFDELHSHQETKFTILNTSINGLNEQNTDIQKSVDLMASQYNTLVSRMDDLEKDNQAYKSQIKTLESKIEFLETGNRSTTIELRNIPKNIPESRESLCTMVQSICSTVKSEPQLQELEVKDIFRTKSNTIVVNFTTITRKENVIRKYKEYNKLKRFAKLPLLNSLDLKIPGPTKPVFLLESLTSKASHLHFLAREMVKQRKISATWTSYGKVYVRKEEGQPSKRINDESDLKNLCL